MHTLHLFTDGSVNTQSKIGCGAYLLVDDITVAPSKLLETVKLKRFEDTSSTKLELQIWLWAVSEILSEQTVSNFTVICYTDSQNIIGLPGRRTRLEGRDYTNSKNKTLNHAELYTSFYRLTDCIHCSFVKVAGHKPKADKDSIDLLFELVDRAARDATRLN